MDPSAHMTDHSLKTMSLLWVQGNKEVELWCEETTTHCVVSLHNVVAFAITYLEVQTLVVIPLYWQEH